MTLQFDYDTHVAKETEGKSVVGQRDSGKVFILDWNYLNVGGVVVAGWSWIGGGHGGGDWLGSHLDTLWVIKCSVSQ